MPEEQKTVTLNRDHYLIQGLALGVAVQLLAKYTDFSEEACKKLITDIAQAQLDVMTDADKEAVTKYFKSLKKIL